MPTTVPDRGDNPRRKVNFYTREGKLSHSADVRWVGDKYKRPHGGDIAKNTKKTGGYKNWEVAD